jgi:hypothetical protein
MQGKTGTHRLLPVYASVGDLEGEELLTSEPDATGLGSCGIFPGRDGCLLLLRAELHRGIKTRKRLGKVWAARPEVPYSKPCAGGPDAPT